MKKTVQLLYQDKHIEGLQGHLLLLNGAPGIRAGGNHGFARKAAVRDGDAADRKTTDIAGVSSGGCLVVSFSEQTLRLYGII